ncbi:uncharacterized protein LOC111000865 [Pieris rapae]|uniref:uncharacterized protein LOC111000865 n=1 Tax=Pieris rapae TaxID=64459 RepID=UPI001E280905|nr:uncharacterized protein LOC111000865 [Pieris rapae]
MASNKLTKEKLTEEYKRVRQRCIDTCNTIVNLNLDTAKNQDNKSNKTILYAEGLQTEIENSNTTIVSDKNCLTSLYLSEMRKKTNHLDELIALTKGSISDTAHEVERLKTLIMPAKAALSKPQEVYKNVTSENIMKTKETFREMKNELMSLIRSLFPDLCEKIVVTLGQLMEERLNEESSGYIEITDENYVVIEILKDISIVTKNPYNTNQVKLAYQ